MNILLNYKSKRLTFKADNSNKIDNRILLLPIKWANYLQNFSRRLSVRTLKCFLIAFCFLFTGISTYGIITSFTNKNVKVISITPIRLPPHSLGPHTNNWSARITYHEYKQLKALEYYLAHLQPSSSGKLFSDSLLQLRSGLLDSIHYLENIYLQQPHKK